ncbi:MAG: CbrC family protein [Ferruginibacter sp.]
MQFKYFKQPELFSSFINEPVACNICKEETKCFDASTFIGIEEMEAICPTCLSAGKLNEKDITTCSGDIGELKIQLKALNKNDTDAEIDKTALGKTNELEKTTPPLITWQDWDWTCAEGDYCQFIGYGSVSLYKKLAAVDDPKKMFEASIYYNLLEDSDAETLWEKDLPRKTIKNLEDSKAYSTQFYVFQSIHSDKIITIWDCD